MSSGKYRIFFEVNSVMSDVDMYSLKANLTTVLSIVFLPVLSSIGMDSLTANSLVGAVSYFVALGLLLYGEKYISKFLTLDRCEDSDEEDFGTA